MWNYNYTPSPDELFHHGIKGQKWGVRRYQNKDGSLTPAGKKRAYGMSKRYLNKKIDKSDDVNRKEVYESYRSDILGNKRFQELGKKSNKIADELMETEDLFQEMKAYGETPSSSAQKRLEKMYEQLNKYDSEMAEIEISIGKKYVDKFNDALLKDIQYSKIEQGRKMLKDYGENYYVTKDGTIRRGLNYIRPHNL